MASSVNQWQTFQYHYISAYLWTLTAGTTGMADITCIAFVWGTKGMLGKFWLTQVLTRTSTSFGARVTRTQSHVLSRCFGVRLPKTSWMLKC